MHQASNPLVLFNVWDAGSARAVAAAGAKAVATGSWAVAAAHGYEDGEKLPLNLALANLERIASSVDLPVSFDLEGGYGADATAVGRNVADAINAGAVGLNLEDASSGWLRTLDDQVARLMKLCSMKLFVARRLKKAGADGQFVPGAVSEALIGKLVKAVALPLNVMVMPQSPPLATLIQLGVARVSHGPGPYLAAMHVVEAQARASFGSTS